VGSKNLPSSLSAVCNYACVLCSAIKIAIELQFTELIKIATVNLKITSFWWNDLWHGSYLGMQVHGIVSSIMLLIL